MIVIELTCGRPWSYHEATAKGRSVAVVLEDDVGNAR